MKNKYSPWLKAFSALSINISAAWFVSVFIGPNITPPKNLYDFLALILNVIFGIIFLLIAVWLERKLKK